MNLKEIIATRRHWLKWLLPLFSVAVLVGVLWLLQRALAGYQLRDISRQMRALSRDQVLAALGFAAASYLVLSGYDLLALRYVKQKVHAGRAMLASFMAFAVGHNIGFTTLTGMAIRIRIYGSDGVAATHVAMVSAFCALTNALGALTLLAYGLLMQSDEAALVLHFDRIVVETLGGILVLALLGYVVMIGLRRKPVVLRGWSVKLPTLPITFAQLLLSILDLCFAAATLYVLLPDPVPVSYATFLAIYVFSILAVLIANVPGGIGVLESVMVLALPQIPTDRLLAALLMLRVIYYLIPLAIAASMLAAHEAWAHWHRVRRVADVAQNWLSAVAPQALGAAVLLAGCILLLSGSTPAFTGRLHALSGLIPLSVMELSHLMGSVAGLGLVVLSHALFRRVHEAWQLAIGMLLAGALFSLFKGWDYEEASIMTAVAGLLLIAKDAFYRRAKAVEGRFSLQWLLGLAGIVAVVLWVGLLAHRHVEYSSELWWTFAVSSDAPRALRTGLAVSLLAAGFIAHNLLSPHPPAPSGGELQAIERVRHIAARAVRTTANLALLGDKRLLVHARNDAFLMYQVSGNSWIAMGDPVLDGAADPKHAADLAWEFRELSDEHGGATVFYQVTPEFLPVYVDLGLALLKLGEEARVDLREFGLEGSRRAELRQLRRRVQRAGASFELAQPPFGNELFARVRLVSDDWLASKAAHEKRFSVGYFDECYLANFPLALVRVGGEIVAFANVWSAARREISVDLMRHSRAAPSGAMDFLFIELMLWATEQGYEWFNLGMAPLSGLEQRPLAPVWHRMGRFVFGVGEHFYNFEGLRRYKDKFSPRWEPRYLAAPGGLALPRVLIDVTTLIAGGLREIVAK